MGNGIESLARDKNRVIDLYASGKIGEAEYARRCRKYDDETAKVLTERTKLLKRIPSLHKRDAVTSSVRLFCESVRADVVDNADETARRKALHEYVEKVTFDHGRITIAGSVPVKKSSRQTKEDGDTDRIPFVIEDILKR